MRIGLGFDLHRIRRASGGRVLLAGIRISAPYRVEAHSDGDFVFHAVADSIASALALGDIGESFPPGDSKTKGMDSFRIIEWVLRKMKKKRRRLLSVSLVVVAEDPRLGPWRDRIRSSLAQALGIKRDKVGLTFKTFEGIGPFARQSVACWANCLIK